MSLPCPRVVTIAPDLPFVDQLATGLLAMSNTGTCELGCFTVFLPSRRACLTLREAFLRATCGRPMLLPQLVPVGEIDEALSIFVNTLPLPNLLPAIPPLRRRLLLTRLVLGEQGSAVLSPAQAAQLSAALTKFLDEVQTQRLDFENLATLVPADYAGHWQITLDFLALLVRVWPQILAVENRLDPAVRRDNVIKSLLTAWKQEPPSDLVVIAGLAHADPVLTDLVTAVAALPVGEGRRGGLIILPGLDCTLDDKSWDNIDETHPQAGLKALLAALDVNRHDVLDWPHSQILSAQRPHPDRLRLVTEALRPAATTDCWKGLAPLSQETLAGIGYLECASPDEEARVISLLLREKLEHQGQTAALVTTDRLLARRVSAELERWDVLVDDSAGVPLAQTSQGVFLRLIAVMVAADFAPIQLLAVLKHPLSAATYTLNSFKQLVRCLEVNLLRGPRQGQGFRGLKAALGNSSTHTATALRALLDWLETVAADFVTLMQSGRENGAEKEVSLTALVEAHVAFSESLATSAHQLGSDRLWQDESGIAAATLMTDLLEAADVFPRLKARFYPALLDSCMESYTVRPTDGRHPRLSILGPLEARLQHPDLLILGGLNEGTWPPVPDIDPWMSRSMRAKFGLPLPERRIGLSAHDFVHAFCAPRVVLTRSQRADGVPTVPSRWLLRLNAVLRVTGLPEIAASTWQDSEMWRLWARALNVPYKFTHSVRPAPRPPVVARPKRLSVTEINTLMQDPYAIYAKRVLRLQPILPLDARLNAAQYGVLVHKALEIFLKRWPPTATEDLLINPEKLLLAVGQEVFATFMKNLPPFWWPRFRRIARWVALREKMRRQRILRVFPEAYGQLMLTIPTSRCKKRPQQCLLTARADRIELLPGNRITIIDYKTGLLPSQREVSLGYESQLPLEGAMAAAGAFPGIPFGSETKELLYWHLTGMNAGGEERRAADHTPVTTLAEKALEGLQTLLTIFACHKTPYEACAHPTRYSPYHHLARTKEWATSERILV